ncbi:MAG: penicillin-insensitive murein endopeptidase, partial [Myxococcota bacterium]|nr:penicillin-insensitive murein endopeptidase [Myxococcota bacterium]
MPHVALLAFIVCIFTVSSPCSAQTAEWVTVRVKRGDTLSGIGKRHGVSIATLRRLNRRVVKNILRPGMVLRIRKKLKRTASKRTKRERKRTPATSRKTQKRTKSATTPAKKISHRRASSTSDRRRKRAKRSRQRKGQWVRYRTKRGDTMNRIAKRFKVRVRDLRSNNRRLKKVKPHRRLKRGLRLKIKRKSTYRLIGGVQLPRTGAGYTRMRPERSWGTPCTIQLIQDVYAEFDARNPGSVRGLIADISDEDGGWLPPHKSHQRGVDIDVSYYKRHNTPMRGLEVVTPESIDISKTWDLMRLFLNTGHIDM